MNSKDKKSLIKKKAITDALKNCLEKSVYSQISLEDVAKEAGLSKGGLRHYFATREELYLDLINEFFSDIQKDHQIILQDFELDSKDKAFISTLFSIERFLLDKKNIKIFINLLLYGFEDEKIMEPIKKFIKAHMAMFEKIIKDIRTPGENNATEDITFIARITQIVLLCVGIFESIDPIEMDTPKLIEFFLKEFKK